MPKLCKHVMQLATALTFVKKASLVLPEANNARGASPQLDAQRSGDSHCPELAFHTATTKDFNLVCL